MSRADHIAIASRIGEGARVLDIGCGDGALLALLSEQKQVDARGLELSSSGVEQCLACGLSVIQGNADEDLTFFPDDGFDVAVLSKTIQETRRPAHILTELSRIAPELIISFRNYGHWRRRWTLLTSGRMPAPSTAEWHDAEAAHPATASDMIALAAALDLRLVGAAPVTAGRVGQFRTTGLSRLNWGAEDAILHLARRI